MSKIFLAIMVGMAIGFIIGIEVETKYCVSYYGAKQ